MPVPEMIWDDIDDSDDNDGTEQFECTDIDVEACANAVLQFVSKNMARGHLVVEATGEMSLSILLPLLHPFLSARFDNAFTLESRLNQIDRVRSIIDNVFSDDTNDVTQQIQTELCKLVPASHSSAYKVCGILFDDDGVCLPNEEKACAVELKIGRRLQL